MRRLAYLAAALLMLFADLGAALAQQEMEPVSMQAPGVLKVAIMNFPGYSEVDSEGNAVGRTVTLVDKLLRQAGFAYEVRILPPARIWRGLEDGSVQLWPGIVNKPGLEASTLLARRTLGVVGINLYYPPGSPRPQWPDDLQGKRVILITNYTYTSQLMRVLDDPSLDITFLLGSSHLGAVRMLLRGRGDYLLDYRAQVDSAAATLHIEPLPHLKVSEQPMRFVVSRRTPGASDVVRALDAAYDQLESQGVELDVTRQ